MFRELFIILHYNKLFFVSLQSFMVNYFKSIEDPIKRSARKQREKREIEDKRQKRRDKRSTGKV